MSVKLNDKDYIWSYIGVFFSLLTNIILTPFVIFFLDGPSLGIWGVYTSLGTITTLFDFGFSTTFGRNINYCWNGAKKLEKEGAIFSQVNNPNFFLMKETMLACKMVFLILSTFAYVIMLSLGTIYIYYISYYDVGKTAIWGWLFYATAIFINLYFGYYSAFLRGVGAISDINKATVFSKLIQIVLTIVLLWKGYGLVGIGIAYLVNGTVFRQIAKYSFFRYKDIGFNLRKICLKISHNNIKEVFAIVWHNAWREGIVSFSNYMANEACTVICSLYLSLEQTGAYSLAVQLAMAVSQISAVMYNANQPVLQSAYILNDKMKIRKTMSLIVVSYTILNLFGLIVVVIIGLPILRIVKSEVVVSTNVMLGIGIYQFMLKFRNCYTSYFSCTNRIPYVNSFLISSLICVLVSLFNLKVLRWEIWGLISAQILSQGVYNFWIWSYRAHKEMGLSFQNTIKYGFEEIINILGDFTCREKVV